MSNNDLHVTSLVKMLVSNPSAYNIVGKRPMLQLYTALSNSVTAKQVPTIPTNSAERRDDEAVGTQTLRNFYFQHHQKEEDLKDDD